MPKFKGHHVSGYTVGEFVKLGHGALPFGVLACDSTTKPRASYGDLFAKICPVLGTASITIASPAVVTVTGHGLETGSVVQFSTTGSLPTGASSDTNYWVIKVDANTFRLATSAANASAGTAINTSGTQSGTHTCRFFPFNTGGELATEFRLPDSAGRSLIGEGSYTDPVTGAVVRVRGQKLGAEKHTLQPAEAAIKSHTHTNDLAITSTGSAHGHQYNAGTNSAGLWGGSIGIMMGANTSAGYTYGDSTFISSTGSAHGHGISGGVTGTTDAPAGSAHNNMQPSLVIKYGIAYC